MNIRSCYQCMQAEKSSMVWQLVTGVREVSVLFYAHPLATSATAFLRRYRIRLRVFLKLYILLVLSNFLSDAHLLSRSYDSALSLFGSNHKRFFLLFISISGPEFYSRRKYTKSFNMLRSIISKDFGACVGFR